MKINKYIKNYIFIYCALESTLWQRLGAIKVELELPPKW